MAATMAESLGEASPREALLALSAASEAAALELAAGLSTSIPVESTREGGGTRTLASSLTSTSGDVGSGGSSAATLAAVPSVPLPRSLRNAPPTSASSSSSNAARVSSSAAAAHPLDTAGVCAESILASLSKIASGGSRASSEMRDLERRRRSADEEADDIDAALRLRRCAAMGADALGARRYRDAAAAVKEYRAVRPTDRAVEWAGPHTVRGYERTVEVLQRAVLERYEGAVQRGDVADLSELTPLLGMLGMAEKGVGLYLRYSQQTLGKAMDLNEPIPVVQEEGMSRAAARRKAADEERARAGMTVCQRLARIFNAAVTHLRHHLPMVAYALGEADGDAALVQLVHLEVEKRAVDILREYTASKALAAMEQKAEDVAGQIEDRCINGLGLEGLGGGGGGGAAGEEGGIGAAANVLVGIGDSTPQRNNRAADGENDCGFTAELGRLADVDAAMDEAALCLQHTESYERFIRHAVDEVGKARELRRKQKQDERRRRREIEEEKRRDAGESDGKKAIGDNEEGDDDEDGTNGGKSLQILPPHTPLNEIVSEVGGYYSGLERCLLLAGMQRAFLNANYPDERNYSPVAILAADRAPGATGSQALQTSIVEECLYAAQRSTLRAFATGHTGTASAAANYCTDTLGRVLLEVLSRRAEAGAAMLRPGDGLLSGQGGLGQAALAVMSTAQKGLRGAAKGMKSPVAVAAAGGKEESPEMVRYRITVGIARATANFNDLEVAEAYTRRLEGKFVSEIDASYPRCHETEQLLMCVKSLGPVADSFRQASDRSLEQLVSTVMPRVRSIVNEAVGQESTTGASFLGGAVTGGVGAAGATTVRFNYDIDEEAYELSQISEGYIGRLCSCLDEMIDPLRMHLTPRLSDALLIGVLGGASKRLEAAIRRSQFTALGALSLDSDIRTFMNFAKDRFDSPELKSNVALCKACNPLSRLSQIALLMNVDDLDDVLDLISSSKRKGNWDLKLDDAKAFLNLRVDFEGRKVNELLQISEGDE